MPISDIPIFSMLKSKMQWHQERQRLLSENVANADTPNFRPRDLTPLNFDRQVQASSGSLAMARTADSHIAASDATSRFASERNGRYDVKPAGNAVSLEDEMMKVAANQMDYQAAISLYSRSMGLFRTALGK